MHGWHGYTFKRQQIYGGSDIVTTIRNVKRSVSWDTTTEINAKSIASHTTDSIANKVLSGGRGTYQSVHVASLTLPAAATVVKLSCVSEVDNSIV